MASARNRLESLFLSDAPPVAESWIARRGTIKQWKKAKTFAALVENNVKLLHGGVCITPSNDIFPHDGEDELMIKKLIRLNEFGLLTINYQPSEVTQTMDTYSLDGSDWFYTSEQKPFVQFIMPAADGAARLLKRLENEEDVKVIAYKLHPYEVIKDITPYCVSQRMYEPDFRELVGTRWAQFTDFQVCGEKEDELFELPVLKTIRPWVIGVASPKEYGEHHDVLRLVEEAAQDIGLTKRFPDIMELF